MSWFGDVSTAPPIEVFALTAKYREDTHPSKVNLGVGAYRTDEGKPWVLPVVRTVETQMATDLTLNHEYLAVAGMPDYRQAATKLLLGASSPALTQNRAGSVQAIGGTGALRIGLDFLHSRLGATVVYVSTPTWGNHKSIANALGYDVREYRYWDGEKRGLQIDAMLTDMNNAPAGAVFLLHMCAQNPTGSDPTMEEWAKIAQVMRTKKLFPFFDCAYQGFSSGDLDADAASLRYFIDQGFELFAAQSFSKNFGLYNERVGNLVYVCSSADNISPIDSQMQIVVRTTWSNPPAHGARVVATILNNSALDGEWKANVQTMAERILKMRKELYTKLKVLGTPGTWDHIVKQTGMFSYTGLNPLQVDHLMQNFHIYLLKNGRVNMCGLTSGNVDYVASAIHSAVTNVTSEPKL